MSDEVYLNDVCRPTQWTTIPVTSLMKSGYPVYGANGVIGFYNEYNHEKPTLLITCRGATCGELNICQPFSYVTGNAMCLDDLDEERADLSFLYYALKKRGFEDVISGTAQPQITRDGLSFVKVSLPSLTEQKRIAARLRRADRLGQLRRTAYDLGDALLQSVFLEMFGEYLQPNCPTTPMEELVKITGGGTPSRDVPEYFQGNIPWLTSKDMRGDYIYDTQEHITERAIRESATNLVPVGSILLVVKSKILMHRLPIAITKVPLCHGQDIKSIQCSNKVNPRFLVAVLKYNEAKILFQARGANTEGLTLPMLNEIKVPNVPLSLQEEFASVVRRVEGLRGRMGESTRQVEGLFESLLAEAFS